MGNGLRRNILLREEGYDMLMMSGFVLNSLFQGVKAVGFMDIYLWWVCGSI